MSMTDVVSFEGQSWSSFGKVMDKESDPQKKVSFVSDGHQNTALYLNKEDIPLYGKYPGSEPFILAMCGYCGDRFKVPALAKHLALRHPDGKVVFESNEKNNQKGDVKSPASILKKNKIKSKKEPPDSTTQSSALKPPNKQPSKVLIQVDRRRVNCSTGRDALFVSKNHPEIQEIKSNIDINKSEKEVIQKPDSTKVKKVKEDRSYPSYKQSSPKLSFSGTVGLSETPLFRKAKIDSKKFKTVTLNVPEKFENKKFKIHDKNTKKVVRITGNGVNNEISEGNPVEIKKRKIMPKTKTYNPDRHCGVLGKENSKPCTRPLDCKSHTMSLRRAVQGRSKNFDVLLADLRAEKVSSKTNNQNEVAMEIIRSPDIVKKLQLTPTKIPLVLNPQLTTKVDPVNDILCCNLIPNININGIKLKCDARTELIHTMNPRSHLLSSSLPRKKTKIKRKKEKKKKQLNNVKKSQVNCFSKWYPWYRRIGGLLYTQNNLPSFTNLKNLKKKSKQSYVEKKEMPKLSLRALNRLNQIQSKCVSKPFEIDNTDWTSDFRVQFINLKNAISIQVYGLDDINKLYFKLTPENRAATILRLRSESLTVLIPRVDNPENQFLIQKKKDYSFLHRHILNFINVEEPESDVEDFIILEEIRDIRFSILEPVRTFKDDITNPNCITLTPLSGWRSYRFPMGTEERNFNLGVGIATDRMVCFETLRRMHFITPSGPMAAGLKLLPAVPESSYDLVKSLVEE